MKLADSGLNLQAEAIETAQTEIRIAVRDGWLYRLPKARINEQVQKIVQTALRSVTNKDLREAAYRSLNAFAERQYTTLLQAFGMDPVYVLAAATMLNPKATPMQKEKAMQTLSNAPTIASEPTYETDAKGVPAQMYSEDYIKEHVRPVFERLNEQNALDPDDVSGRNSLRNRAEMEVRYERHEQEKEELRSAGVKLVTTTVHADCSSRCYAWQGRVYSLDGTSGKTADGKSYVPLETATDVWYTTKAGKRYKNGLLGFNCRHKLIEYKAGMVIPRVSAETQKKENAINTRQRELEREVRKHKQLAAYYKDIDRSKYLAERKRAIEVNKEYIAFSHDNGRAYYPSRTKLL